MHLEAVARHYEVFTLLITLMLAIITGLIIAKGHHKKLLRQ